ncbi:MAG: dihydrofolate reductase family protein [Terracoccus sp.]
MTSEAASPSRGLVRIQLSMSLDGFGAGLGTSVEHPLGVGGEALHVWLGDDHPVNRRAGEATFEAAGAVVVGRTMFDAGLPLWPAGTFAGLPVVVATHRPQPPLPFDDRTTFDFVGGTVVGDDSGGIHAVVTRARELAGDRDVVVLGGPTTARAVLVAGLADEIRLQAVHVVLGSGVSFFDAGDPAIARFAVAESHEAPGVTHVRLVVTGSS